ncbi:MAG: respiratory nitrate reductase subunit beta [Deltaproteobacteria bacterium]|nr:respiratory nitrate reductase subunit beta [Deltaproteobacteria bacterium]
MSATIPSKQQLKSCKRQLATVIDLNKCMGCQTCSVACKNIWTQREGTEHMRWASVATCPGSGYPRDWEKKGGGFDAEGRPRAGQLTTMVDCGDSFQFNHEEALSPGASGGRRLEPRSLQGGAPTWGYNWDEDQGKGEWPNPYFFYMPRKCNHCTNAPCIDACSRNAIFKREDGIVVIDQDRCAGHRHCIEACPYSMIFFNPVTQKSEKCIDCFPRVEQGIAPACNRQCVGRTRAYGYLDDPESQVHKLVRKWKVAVPLHPEYGTEPNVYYVPPMSPLSFDGEGKLTEAGRIPIAALERYFGPAVRSALGTLVEERKRRQRGEPSELMDLLISRRWSDRFAEFTREPV